MPPITNATVIERAPVAAASNGRRPIVKGQAARVKKLVQPNVSPYRHPAQSRINNSSFVPKLFFSRTIPSSFDLLTCKHSNNSHTPNNHRNRLEKIRRWHVFGVSCYQSCEKVPECCTHKPDPHHLPNTTSRRKLYDSRGRSGICTVHLLYAGSRSQPAKTATQDCPCRIRRSPSQNKEAGSQTK